MSAPYRMSNLQAIDEDGLMENSRVVGDRLASGLNKLRQKYDIIGKILSRSLHII